MLYACIALSSFNHYIAANWRSDVSTVCANAVSTVCANAALYYVLLYLDIPCSMRVYDWLHSPTIPQHSILYACILLIAFTYYMPTNWRIAFYKVYPCKFKNWLFIKCVLMLRFTMLTCVGLIVCGCTATFHAICVYSTHLTLAVYPFVFPNCLFTNSARMWPYMRIWYWVYSTTISLPSQELAIDKMCENAALYYVGMSRSHGLGQYLNIPYYMRI